jgi:hypothetical protein
MKRPARGLAGFGAEDTLSTAQREMIFSYCNSGKTARECHDGLFLGSEQLCKLKNIQKIYRLFNDETKEKDMVQYLANSKSRGPQLKDNNEQWYDDLVGTLNTNYPTVTTIVLRQHLEAAIGGSSTDQCVPSTSSIERSLKRTELKRKRCTFLSNAQNPVEVYDHMARMANVDVDDIINIDETSANSKKFRPTHGRGIGEVVIPEFRIGEKMYSAIAALTTAGFLPCTKIYDSACDSVSIQSYLNGLEPFVLQDSVCLLDNASVNVCEDSLQVVDRVFNGRWARNAAYSPRLAPIERGFSLVWRLVQQRWEEAQRDPIRVLEECFRYYEVGQPGGIAC